MKLGKLQIHALDFVKACKGWQSFSTDVTTKRVIESLKKKGLVEIYKPGNQFKAI